jgi:dehydrogenase/reductase SDR family protein 12
MVCRDKTAGEEARGKIISDSGNNEVYLHLCDCSVFSSVRSLAAELSESLPRVDVLVNNAGCLPTTRNTTSEGNEVIIATALGGTMLLTDLLLPLLRKSASFPVATDSAKATPAWTGGRVINVSSGGGYNVHANLVDLNLSGPTSPPYDGTLFYAYAKRAQMDLTKVWAKKLISAAAEAPAASPLPLVAVHCMHPGWASTEGLKVAMSDFHDSRKDSLRTAEQGADTIIYLSCAASAGPRPASSSATTSASALPVPYAGGEFWFDREVVPTEFPLTRTSSTDAEREQLWSNTAKFVGGLKNI